MKKNFFNFFLFFFLFLSLSFFDVTSSPVHAAEGDTYSFTWLDQDKEVYVLQNRKFRKAGRFHLNLGTGITTSGAFVDAMTFQGRAGYFFKEEWGVEFVYAINEGEENNTAKALRNEGSSGSVPFRRIVDGYYGGMLMWSPFYSKINTFNKIIYLDWMVGVGLAQLTESNNFIEFTSNPDSNVQTQLTHTGIMWDTALKFYINQNFEIRADLTVVHYQAERPNSQGRTEDDYYSNWDFALSLGYSF